MALFKLRGLCLGLRLMFRLRRNRGEWLNVKRDVASLWFV